MDKSDTPVVPADLLDLLEEPVLVMDRDFRVVFANATARRAYDVSLGQIRGCTTRCHQLTHHIDDPCESIGLTCPVRTVLATSTRTRVLHNHWHGDKGTRWEEIIATPILSQDGEVVFIMEEIRDATELLNTKEVVELLRDELKTLRNLLPICASCKQIRQDDGSWLSVEEHLAQHANMDFTHGICPTCVAKLYPKMDGGGL